MKTCPVCDTLFPDQHNTCPTDGAVLLETRELEPGQTVRGKYRIVRKLGQGGMGTVYLAEHQMLGGQVALKFLASALSQDPQFVKRFRNEARAAYLLRHPNIVEVTDLDQNEDGSLFLAMEYVSGPSLRHAMKELHGSLPARRAIEIARGVAAGLAVAHQRGAVHRDIKPENILLAVGPDGTVQPKVLDFGIAAMTDGATRFTRTTGLLLTPEYAAPEQWQGMPAGEMDGRTDLYALGGVIYEMLAGHKAFHAVNAQGWMYQHLQCVPPPLGECRPDLEREWPGLAAVTMRLLEKDRERRLVSAEAVVEALEFRPGIAAPWPVWPSVNTQPQSAPQPAQTPAPIPIPAFIEPVPPPRQPSAVTPAGQQTSQAPDAEPATAPKHAAKVDGSQTRPGGARYLTAPGPKSESRRRHSSWIWTALAASVAVVLGLILLYRLMRPATAAPEIAWSSDASTGLRSVVITERTPEAAIHYTVDGSEPTEISPLYNAPVNTLSDGKVDVRARAFVSGHKPSPIVQMAVPEAHSAPAHRAPEKEPATNVSGDSLYDQAKSSYDSKQYADARRLFAQSCDAGELRACDYLGYLYSEGKGGPEDAQMAGKIYLSACGKGFARSCTALGVLYMNADDQPDARTYIGKGCDGGDADGCKLKHKVQ